VLLLLLLQVCVEGPKETLDTTAVSQVSGSSDGGSSSSSNAALRGRRLRQQQQPMAIIKANGTAGLACGVIVGSECLLQQQQQHWSTLFAVLIALLQASTDGAPSRNVQLCSRSRNYQNINSVAGSLSASSFSVAYAELVAPLFSACVSVLSCPIAACHLRGQPGSG
jgi:hypothetical protein